MANSSSSGVESSKRSRSRVVLVTNILSKSSTSMLPFHISLLTSISKKILLPSPLIKIQSVIPLAVMNPTMLSVGFTFSSLFFPSVLGLLGNVSRQITTLCLVCSSENTILSLIPIISKKILLSSPLIKIQSVIPLAVMNPTMLSVGFTFSSMFVPSVLGLLGNVSRQITTLCLVCSSENTILSLIPMCIPDTSHHVLNWTTKFRVVHLHSYYSSFIVSNPIQLLATFGFCSLSSVEGRLIWRFNV
ncbi:hypothetical protein IGI04_015022 [Brassica rapa subsp. trilocularis]|uniref:Uncharacterized protein n=1 Tax=Brassica rapa subsp. trilocularis TaxID=1813537 RepID=A0ABQ7MPH1_BRACM|nr:hypothetical protein IGI04_015022 [Brassica rapa subsp. trilocularis]